MSGSVATQQHCEDEGDALSAWAESFELDSQGKVQSTECRNAGSRLYLRWRQQHE